MCMGILDQVGEGPDTYSALSAIDEAATFSQRSGSLGAFQIKGGNDLLPRAFAERLGQNTQYNSPVVAISQITDGVELTVKIGHAGSRFVAITPFAARRSRCCMMLILLPAFLTGVVGLSPNST